MFCNLSLFSSKKSTNSRTPPSNLNSDVFSFFWLASVNIILIPLFKKPIYIEGKKDNIELECSLKWNASYAEDIFPYTNNIYQKDGGTHLLGFRSALTRVINKYANEHNLLKKNKLAISGDDIKEGLTCDICKNSRSKIFISN